MAGPRPQHFSVSELKSKILYPAQTSVYLVDVTSGLTQPLREFMSNYRGFNVTTDGAMMRLLCSEASMPGSGMATHEVNGDFSGVTEKMVYRRIYDDTIDLTFYIDSQYKVHDFFENWFNYCVGEGSTLTRTAYKNSNAFYRMNYPDNYKGTIYITKFEKTNSPSQPAIYYTFVKAFPTNISSIPISYNASDLLKVTVSFSYTRYVKETQMVKTADKINSEILGSPEEQANFNAPKPPKVEPSDLMVPKQRKITDEYYNNFGDSSQDSTNFGNYYDGRNVDRNVLGSSAVA
jgi:hypothetical protein